MTSEQIPHGSPEMLCQELASTTAAAAFHAEMASHLVLECRQRGMPPPADMDMPRQPRGAL